MTAASKPPCKTAVAWLTHHKGKGCFAPFTGQDMAMWRVFVHAVDAYGYSDMNGRRAAIAAMRAAVSGMQPQVRHMCRDVIPHARDWSDIPELWPQIADAPPVFDDDSPKAVLDELRLYRAGRPS